MFHLYRFSANFAVQQSMQADLGFTPLSDCCVQRQNEDIGISNRSSLDAYICEVLRLPSLSIQRHSSELEMLV